VEIDWFQLSVDKRHFLICTSKGDLIYYSVKDGKMLKKIWGHKKEVSHIFTDHKNNLISSSGWDGKILIQKAVGKKSAMRKQKNSHFGKPISIMCVWVETNYIATWATDYAHIWSYDSLRLHGIWACNGNEICAMKFYDDKPFLITLDRSSSIKIWFLKSKELYNFYRPIVHIKTSINFGDHLSTHCLFNNI